MRFNMPVNFTQLLQDSWNFVRNQKNFTLSFVIAFTLLSFAINMIFDASTSALTPDAFQQLDNPDLTPEQQVALFSALLQKIDANFLLFIYIVYQVIFLLFSCWEILTVHHISLQNNYSLTQTFGMALKRFFGVLIINILISLPLLICFTAFLVSVLSGSGISILIVFVFFSIFIFIRTCLAFITYLIEEKGIGESIAYIWRAGIGRTTTLLWYFLIVYLIFSIISNRLADFSNNMPLGAIATLLVSFLNVFAVVISYRFYTIFTQRA